MGTRIAGFLALAWAVIAAGAVCAQPAERAGDAAKPVATGRITHVRVLGDLDNRKIARDIVAEIERAKRERTGLIILELECTRSRPDVVWEVGRAVKESEIPVAAYLHDGPEGRLAPGALEIGLLANECHVRRKTTVRDTSDDDPRWMGPPEVSWERIDRELTGALWVTLKERGADQVLGTLLVSRRPSAWLVPDGPAAKLAVSEPALGSGANTRQVVFPAETGGLGRIELRAEDLAALNAAKVDAESVTQVASAGGRIAGSRTSRTVLSDLGGARNRVTGSVDEARAASQRAEELLDVKRRARGRTVTSQDYHEAARDALLEIERAAGLLKAADGEIAAYPELVRRKPDPPGAPKRRTKAEDPVLGSITDLEKSVEKLRVRAEEYARKK